jgi:hypothetical protein
MVRLFKGRSLHDELDSWRLDLAADVDRLPPSEVLQSDHQDSARSLAEAHRVAPIRLLEENIESGGREADVDVSGRPDRLVLDRSRPLLLKGTVVEIYVPYQGDSRLLHLEPSIWTSTGPPNAEVREHADGGEIILSFETVGNEDEQVQRELNSALGQVRTYVQSSTSEVGVFNESLEQQAASLILARRERLNRDANMIASFGYPIRRRDNAPQTYSVPAVRSRAVRTYEPGPAITSDPALPSATYEHILSVLSNVTEVMERSPRAFRTLHEEDIRFHFLVQLNGQYDGQGIAEAFNYEGKTDILVLWQGKRVFIAECAFWKGPKTLTDKIDQLLTYVTWRDTKTAIVLFNKNKRITDVLAAVPTAVQAHPNFQRRLPDPSVGGSRYVMTTRDDPNREFLLTVLVFDVPKTADEADAPSASDTERVAREK